MKKLRLRLPRRLPCPRGAWLTLATALIATASAAILLTGCATPGDIRPLSRTLSAADSGIPENAPALHLDDAWWRQFGDATLDALVAKALADAPTVQAAQARIRIALAQVDATDAADAPQLDATGRVTRQRYSQHALFPPGVAGSIKNDGLLQLAGSWDLDLFGRNRAALEAALGRSRAAQADAAMARLMLASEVVGSYVRLWGLLEQEDVVRRALTQRATILALVGERARRGIDSEVEVRQAEGAVPEAKVQLEHIEHEVQRTRHALAALTAQPPTALDGLQPGTPAPTLQLPQRIPADLLGRRPDVVAARWRAEAARGERVAARRAFYPSVDLLAFAGLSSISLSTLAEAGSRQFGIGPAIHLPIFDAGRLRADYGRRTAEVDVAVAAYNRAVLESVRQAADQIDEVRSVQQQVVDQAAATRAARRAYDLVLARYRAGVASYLAVLTVEGNLLRQDLQQAKLQTHLLTAKVGLVRALGGGYAEPAEGAQPRVASTSSIVHP